MGKLAVAQRQVITAHGFQQGSPTTRARMILGMISVASALARAAAECTARPRHYRRLAFSPFRDTWLFGRLPIRPWVESSLHADEVV